MITRHDVVDVIDASRPHSNFRKISGPNTTVSILGLVLTEICRIDVIVDVPITLIPLLVIILLVVLMSWVNCEVLGYPGRQLKLLVCLIQQQVVLLAYHTVAVATIFREDLEASSDAARIICAHELVLRPLQVAMVSSHL